MQRSCGYLGPTQQLLCVSLLLSLGKFTSWSLLCCLPSILLQFGQWFIHSQEPNPSFQAPSCCQGGWLSFALPCKCPKFWLKPFPVGSSPCQEGRWEPGRDEQEISLGEKPFPLGLLFPEPWQLPLAPACRNWGGKGHRNRRYFVESRTQLALDHPAQEMGTPPY